MAFIKKDITEEDILRVMSRVKITAPGLGIFCCMEWTGKIDRGYGRVSLNGNLEHVHLIFYRYFKGDYNADRFVIRHSCDNKLCCNPYHLVKGTQSQNMQEWHERKKHE